MADGTLISWSNATWNLITGCSIESPGCKHCYAMRLAGGRLQHHRSRAGLTQESAAGPVWTGKVRFNDEWLRQPLQWTRPRMIFVCAHSDLFHEAVPDAWIDCTFAVMAAAGRHTYQCLTKRPARAAQYLAGLRTPAGMDRIEAAARALGYTLRHHGVDMFAYPQPGIWIGTSVENQAYADKRRPPMRAIADAGWTTWVSYEPALDMVDWAGWEFLRWAVDGGESGLNARPAHVTWYRALRDWCSQHGIAYHHKQNGAWIDHEQPGVDRLGSVKSHLHQWPDGTHSVLLGAKLTGRLLDGELHGGCPEAQK